VPDEHRTDSLAFGGPNVHWTFGCSASPIANLERDAREDTRVRYEALCADYGMEPTRNNRGIRHCARTNGAQWLIP